MINNIAYTATSFFRFMLFFKQDSKNCEQLLNTKCTVYWSYISLLKSFQYNPEFVHINKKTPGKTNADNNPLLPRQHALLWCVCIRLASVNFLIKKMQRQTNWSVKVQKKACKASKRHDHAKDFACQTLHRIVTCKGTRTSFIFQEWLDLLHIYALWPCLRQYLY